MVEWQKVGWQQARLGLENPLPVDRHSRLCWQLVSETQMSWLLNCFLRAWVILRSRREWQGKLCWQVKFLLRSWQVLEMLSYLLCILDKFLDCWSEGRLVYDPIRWPRGLRRGIRLLTSSVSSCRGILMIELTGTRCFLDKRFDHNSSLFRNNSSRGMTGFNELLKLIGNNKSALGNVEMIFFLISSFLYAAKSYDNYEQIIMGLAGHIAMWPPSHL